jgi:inorganic pyrophosphatase
LPRWRSIGFAYPYDWRFVPSTLAADGDTLDALDLSEVGSHPGAIELIEDAQAKAAET